MITTLTSRERVNRALDHLEHDRVPRYESFWWETIQRWEKEGLVGGGEAVLNALDADLRSIGWPSLDPFPGRQDAIAEDANTTTYINGWGESVRYFKNRQTTPEHVGWECVDPDIWRERFRPRFENQTFRGLDEFLKKFADSEQRQHWRYLAGLEPFEILRHLLGDVEAMMALIEEPEWIQEIAEVTTACTIGHLETLWEHGVRPEGLWIYGDMAYNHSTFCSPAIYEAVIWPSHQRLCAWAHEHGMKFIYHTDGDVKGVLPLYIKAGFDCLQPLECKANMNLHELVPQYGDQITFFGNVDVMTMLDNDLEKIEAELAAKIQTGKTRRGYIYHSDHSIPPQVSWATYQAIIKMVERYGEY